MNSHQNLASELALFDAIGQSELVRRREITSRELVQAAIDRIEASDVLINAVSHKRFERALEEAEASCPADTPLAGVPFLLKDLGAAQAGVPQTFGNVALKQVHHVPEADDPLGQRFRQAGLLTVGVSNVPEFGLVGDTQPLAFGPTRNPWCLNRSASGSSGGAAAAVAAGFVPVAGAGDAAGSIRQPAAWCGVVGLKTSRGRTPRPVGPIDDIWSSQLVISRTVRDTAAVLDAVKGSVTGDLYGLPLPDSSYTHDLQLPMRPLRIGLLTHGPVGVAVEAECLQAVIDTGKLLEDAGHEVETTYPPAMVETIPEWVNRIRRNDIVTGSIDWLAKVLGRPVTQDDVEPTTWAWYRESEPVSAADLRASLGWHLQRSSRLLSWWEHGFDLLLTPVTNQMPDRLDALALQSPAEVAETERRHATFLEPFNASGQPAITFPVYWTDDNIPVGVQIAAARGNERLLLQVATYLEEAIGWASRRPGL